MAGNGMQRLSAVMACASLVAVGACSGRNGDANRDTTSTAASGGDVARDTAAAAMAPAGGAAGTAAGTSGGTSAMRITGGDPEILQVLATVDQSEVAAGQMALSRARNPQVKSFARELVSDHSQSLRQDRQLAKTANVQLNTMGKGATAGSTATSGAVGTGATARTGGDTTGRAGVAMQLQTMNQQKAQQLRSLQGAAFDSAFIDAMVTGHQQALSILQGAQGQAQNSGVKQHLTTAEQGVQKHLDRARAIQQSLTSGGAGMSGDSAKKGRTGSDTGRKG